MKVLDSPGFIVDRLLAAAYMEAIGLLEEGVAGVDEIDMVMCEHGAWGMGPFQRMDAAGLDSLLAIVGSICRRGGCAGRVEPRATLADLVERGFLGRKTGRGFYGYGGAVPLPACPVDRRSFELPPLLADAMLAVAVRGGAVQAGSTEQYVFARILASWMNEAAHVYSAGVANGGDIDVAMREGAGFPRGPLAWSDDIGHRTVRGLLQSLGKVLGGGRYTPAELFANAP